MPGAVALPEETVNLVNSENISLDILEPLNENSLIN
jgi:hypothetical protein